MALIAAQYVKDNFPPWETYCTVTGYTADQVLLTQIDLAEVEFLEYVTVDEATITDQLLRHLLMIVRKNCADIKHGDTEFETKPQIYKDYAASMEWLGQHRMRMAGQGTTADISITAKRRRFGVWFNETGCTGSLTTPE